MTIHNTDFGNTSIATRANIEEVCRMRDKSLSNPFFGTILKVKNPLNFTERS